MSFDHRSVNKVNDLSFLYGMPSTRKQKHRYKWSIECKCLLHKPNTSRIVAINAKKIPKWKISKLIAQGFLTPRSNYICENCLDRHVPGDALREYAQETITCVHVHDERPPQETNFDTESTNGDDACFGDETQPSELHLDAEPMIKEEIFTADETTRDRHWNQILSLSQSLNTIIPRRRDRHK